MISIEQLRAISAARLQDAIVLLAYDRIDSAAYLCGYAVELALKARICVTLNWEGFPETRGEFEDFSTFRTHKLDVLLRLSGQEKRIKAEQLYEWSSVVPWNPERRYKAVGHSERADVEVMLASATLLLEVL
jgi:HEPN domain-containing protein